MCALTKHDYFSPSSKRHVSTKRSTHLILILSNIIIISFAYILQKIKVNMTVLTRWF